MTSGEPGRQLALARLRAAILDGDVAPGQRLAEEELASTFGVTRASVRAALIDLAADGLVERVPHRGARVRVVSVAEAVAITECRMVLEGLCAAKAAERADAAALDVLAGIGDAMRQAVAAGDPIRYSALNRQLHRLVREVADQPIAAELLDRLHGQIVRHQFRLSLRPGRPQLSLPEHLAIIDAITRRDPAAAEAAVHAHLASVIAALHEADNANSVEAT
jgi:DNA-binding GntR family transcriptional regulator